MKCHYIHDKIAGKVLIPGCMGVAVHNDISYCTCSSTHKSMEERVSKLEEELNKLKSNYPLEINFTTSPIR